MFKCSRRYAFTQAQRRSLGHPCSAPRLRLPQHHQGSDDLLRSGRYPMNQPQIIQLWPAVIPPLLVRSCFACLFDGLAVDLEGGQIPFSAHVRREVSCQVDEACTPVSSCSV